MEVADVAAEEEAAQERKDGIPEPAVEERHRTRLHSAFEAVAHHQVIALAQLREEGVDSHEVVRPVRITITQYSPRAAAIPVTGRAITRTGTERRRAGGRRELA